MESLCPDCNTELTPSIVGYLCHGCGSVHSFEKVATARATSGKASPQKNLSSSKTKVVNQKSSHTAKSTQTQKTSGITHSVKKFIMPEIAILPKPIDESHLINSHYQDNPIGNQEPLGSVSEAVPPRFTHSLSKDKSNQKISPSFAENMAKQDIQNNEASVASQYVEDSKQSRLPIVIASILVTVVVILILALILKF
ncbi:hypothetical protein H0W80_01450 [Candidatus Saccharibacteria bacterium]|nr:hypothetical protein [Candidatus Saccharibacteria bacterium]